MTIQIRRDTAANWTSANPVLADGQPGWEKGTGKLKVGDGATAWTALAYFSGGYTVASAGASYSETATSGEKIIKVTASGITATLPTAVGNAAKLTFKLMVAGTLTIDGAGSETIDGALTAVLTSQYAAVTIVSDNANWIIV